MELGVSVLLTCPRVRSPIGCIYRHVWHNHYIYLFYLFNRSSVGTRLEASALRDDSVTDIGTVSVRSPILPIQASRIITAAVSRPCESAADERCTITSMRLLTRIALGSLRSRRPLFRISNKSNG